MGHQSSKACQPQAFSVCPPVKTANANAAYTTDTADEEVQALGKAELERCNKHSVQQSW